MAASGQSLHYKIVGHGPDLILLHGFLESSSIWDDLIHRMKNDFRIIAIDLPGHGSSASIGPVCTMQKMADEVQEVLEKEHISQARFMGHSMGGYVLLALLDSAPKLFEGLILLNSTTRADSQDRIKTREQALRLLEHNKTRYLSNAIKNLFATEDQAHFVEAIDGLVAQATSFSTQGISAAIRGMMERKDHSYTLQQFKGNKHAISGKRDPLLSPAHNVQWTEESQTPLSVLDCGHMAWLEKPSEIVKIVHFIE